ncbi:hypothetical protein FEM48_Zijuj12G0142800 [Ziziphus jujuba var. spinosa]|uniref:Uncharacterized protein n=1 Tax=Ziziphus jujuba var. spinosa TaxID=714518 RepID=A0A978UDT9_ZIZJJ|nr:hypothetical protein FEM48_Zijuj12G0142800 [Ziziphus jujuba var. spinosa]
MEEELENFLQEFAKKLKSKPLRINGGTCWLVSSIAEGGKQRKEIFTLECQPLAVNNRIAHGKWSFGILGWYKGHIVFSQLQREATKEADFFTREAHNGAREIVIRNFGMHEAGIQCHRKLDPNIGYSRGKFLINWRARISSHLELRIREFGLSQGNSL